MEQGAEAAGVAGLVGAGHDVSAMEGHERGQAAVVLEKGEQVHAGVTKVDVEKVGFAALEDFQEGAVFATLDICRAPAWRRHD